MIAGTCLHRTAKALLAARIETVQTEAKSA